MAKITSTTTRTTRIISRTVPIRNLRLEDSSRDIISAHRPEKDRPLPEYDSLADLYDLEYPHDYDVPFWLALANREGCPVVEWGAGTGRIAAPLAEAGLEVTAVELSEKMVERGREKGGEVEWIHADMRSAQLGRRYELAVCAFNSFLC